MLVKLGNLLPLFVTVTFQLVCGNDNPGAGLGDLAKILAELSGGSDCSFKCPKGKRYFTILHQLFNFSFTLLISEYKLS